jgi:hypothetical protein
VNGTEKKVPIGGLLGLLYEMIAANRPCIPRNRDIMLRTILKQEWVTFVSFFRFGSALSFGPDPDRTNVSKADGAEVPAHPFLDTIDWDLLH